MSPKDDVLAQLLQAAELEHQLMVQYLFAAYSLKTEPDEFAGAVNAHQSARRNRGWRDRILGIAREEMGHLITVQQVIQSLGGKPHFDRDSFPILQHFYPFDFTLEPLSMESLAKYLWSEKPMETKELTRDTLLGSDRAEIENLVYGHAPNELGKLYNSILCGLALLPCEAFEADVANQTDLSRWPGLGRLAIVERVADKAAALKAVQMIVEQGEGHLSAKVESHFHRFLDLYREFRQAVAAGEEPSRKIATDPNTADPNESGPDRRRNKALEKGRITAQPALRWARLFNKRYSILLANLTHALTLPAPAPGYRALGPVAPGKSLDEDELGYLTHERIAGLHPSRVRALTTAQVNDLSDDCVAKMSIEQVAAFGTDQLHALSASQIRALATKALGALDPPRIASLNTEALDALLSYREKAISEAQKETAALAFKNHVQLEALIRWCRDEMILVIAPIARYLTRLPIRAGEDLPTAGAPFELSGTGPTLPADEKTRWCAHQRLIDETRLMIAAFPQPVDDPLGLHSAIEAIDRGRADFIADQLTSVTRESLERADAVADRIETEWDSFSRFDLRLMRSFKAAEDVVPDHKEKRLVIVAAERNHLHFRIFDGDDNAVVDTDEKKLTKQARRIDDLKKQLEGLWPLDEVPDFQKTYAVISVTRIVAYTPRKER
jgi:hypothetical protein